MSSTKWNKAGLITNFDRILGVFSRALFRLQAFHASWREYCDTSTIRFPILSQGHPSYVSTMQMEQAGLITADRILGVFSRAFPRLSISQVGEEYCDTFQLSVFKISLPGHPSYVFPRLIEDI
jgi:hypothetical protein